MTLANLIRRKREPQPAPPAQGAGTRSPSSDFQRRREAEPGPQTYRRWSIRTPDGQTWDVTRCPPVAAGELARSWPPGSVLEPLADQPRPTDSPALDGALEARIRAWLESIEEADTAIIAEVLDLCADDPAILAMYLGLAEDVLVEKSSRDVKCCGTCLNADRTGHPHLVRCRVGEPAPTCGQFWDTDLRSCPTWEARQ